MQLHRKEWVASGCTATGGAHRRRGLGGDDAHLLFLAGNTGFVCAADGAGGATHSAAGAKAAVFGAMDWIAHNRPTPNEFGGLALMARCFSAARAAVAKEAAALGVAIGDLATTLIVAAVNEGGVLAGQVGDGAVVIETRRELRAVLWDASGGAANKSDFLTDPDYLDRLRTTRVRERMTGVVVVTDGVEGLTVSRRGDVNQGFYRKLLETVRNRPEWGEGSGLDRLLESNVIRDRCDDDLTIAAVALRETQNRARQMARPVRRRNTQRRAGRSPNPKPKRGQ